MDPHSQFKKDLSATDSNTNGSPSGTGEDTGFQSMAIPLHTAVGSGISDQSNPDLFSKATSTESGVSSFDARAFFEDQIDERGNVQRKSLAERVLSALTEDPTLKNSIQNITPLSHGGMGLIYQGCHKILGDVVIKVPDPGLAMTATFQTRFLQEAQRLFGLHHQNVVKVTDAGITERAKLPYYIMELIKAPHFLSEGHFGNYIDFIRAADSRVDWGRGEGRKGIEYIVAVCGAVEELHRCGIIHRDLKPANVMLHSENRRITPKVIDLGVGKSIEEATVTANESATDSVTAASKDGVLQLTKFGRAVGTPAYMAPEQQRGEATVSSDVYGLGGILCTLLTGKTTIDYKADSHIQDDLPKDLRAILDKCLAEDPKLRYATPLELQADLQAWLRKGEVQAYIATMGPGSLIRYRSQRKVEALVRAVKTHPYVSGSILVAALGGSFVAKNHYERVEAQRVADVQAEKDRTELANILFNAKVRLSLMQDEEIQIDNSNNVPSSIDLLTSLSRFKSSPEAQQLAIELGQRREELELLNTMRQVTIDGQKKRFASFELGKIEPLDVAAFQAVYKVYLKEGFTVDEVNRFVDWMNKSKYTEEQRMEIIEAVVQSVMVENYALLAQNQKPNNAREIKEFLEERAENLQSMLVALNICSAEKSIRFLMTFRSVIAAEFGEVEERLKWRNAADTAPSEPMLAVELVAGFTHRNMLGRDSSRFSSQLNQVSILHERNVPAAILTIEYMLQRISNETNTERRIRSLGELVSTFARQEKNMGDNPFFLVQYGRTALTLGKLEIVNPGSVRGNINGRRLAEFCFERAIHLLEKEQKVAVPADLKRDFGETLIALRSRVVEAVATLESVIEDVPDREGVYFSIQVGRAISKQELDVEFGRSLLADSKLRSDRPFDSCLVFAGLIRQRVEDSQVFENAIEEQIANLEGFSSEEIAEARWMLQRVKSLASPEIY